MAMTDSAQTTTGWIVFIGALGMMCGMEAVDIAALKTWSEMQTPLFVGALLGHIAAVVLAFVGGKIIPESRSSQHSRATDTPLIKEG